MATQLPITITVTDNRPEHFGFTGLCLYQADTKTTASETLCEINQHSKNIHLGKSYWDVAVFLSNSIEPSSRNKDLKTYVTYGNPDNLAHIKNNRNPDGSYQVVGYLNQKDIQEVLSFLSEHQLSTSEGISKYDNNLSPEVKQELLDITGDDDYEEIIHSMTSPMPPFFEYCLESKSEVVIIYFA